MVQIVQINGQQAQRPVLPRVFVVLRMHALREFPLFLFFLALLVIFSIPSYVSLLGTVCCCCAATDPANSLTICWLAAVS
jgi:hypothetical protein